MINFIVICNKIYTHLICLYDYVVTKSRVLRVIMLVFLLGVFCILAILQGPCDEKQQPHIVKSLWRCNNDSPKIKNIRLSSQ